MEAETLTRNRGMTSLRAVIAAAGQREWYIKGDYFHVYSAPVNDLFVRFDDGEPIAIAQGVGLRRYYEKVTLESATGQTVVVYGGFGSVADARATANVNVTANVAPGNTFDDGGDVAVPDSSVEPLIGADADRLYVIVTNPSDSSGPVRVGTATVDVTKGQLVEPGVSAPIATTAALYAYHENGGPITLSVAAVRQV